MWFLLLFLTYATLLSIALSRAGLRLGPAPLPTPSGPPPARVLVVGATGGTGRQLVSQALERGYVVTALARRASRLKLEHPNLAKVDVNVLDAAVLDAVLRGQDAVLCALGHRRYGGPTTILSQGTRNLLRAMEAHGVRRLVCETSLGIGDSAFRMGLVYTFFNIPIVLPFYFWDKTRQERAIAASRVEWVIVRPGALTNRPKRGAYRHGRVGSFFWTVRISRADVAEFMLDQLTEDTHLGTAVGVSG